MAEGRSRAAQVWFGHLDRARAECVSLKAYAEHSGMSLHRLYIWSARRRAQAALARPGRGCSPASRWRVGAAPWVARASGCTCRAGRCWNGRVRRTWP